MAQNNLPESLKYPLNMKTKTINKVLIALDYDPSAEKVAESGYSLARSLKAEVVLLFVISDQAFYSTAEPIPMAGVGAYLGVIPMQFENIESLREGAKQLLEKIKHALGNESISTLIEEGDTATSILSAAKATNADLIVMGSHSRKWLENIVMGSVTQEVLRKTKLPVYIIPIRKQD
jgi:nucleotide-binding universal stress UspA family protein